MRLSVAIFLLAASSGAAFAPSSTWGVASRYGEVSSSPALHSTVEQVAEGTVVGITSSSYANGVEVPSSALSASEINSRLQRQMEKLSKKDGTSRKLSKEDIPVVHEDDHIIVVNKPTGVLCVGGVNGCASLAQAVHENFSNSMDSADKMVIHRLGMDTSGLVVLAKTVDAVRAMNSIFRSRKIERTYEALVCGHISQDSGIISLPLMRDYECPPFVRISTDEHQRALIGLDPAEVGKKLLQRPKDSLTKFQVLAREELDGQPVTRVALTSVSGRTHQLNVHLAAFGHPIVGDSTYGMGGDASPNGGLSLEEQDALIPNPSRANADVQKALSSKSSAHIHSKSLKFRHPVTKESVSLSADAPF